MATELIAGLGLFKTAFDIAKGLKDINDATIRNAAIIELQEMILSAQQSQSALVDRVRYLEKEMADLKAWEGEKEQYELKSVSLGAFAYVPKPNTKAAKEPHWLCANCAGEGKKKYLQITKGDMTQYYWSCPECKNFIRVRADISPQNFRSNSTL